MFRVTATDEGVKFSIDHQTFWLRIEDDTEQPKTERYRWYARQLRVALARLESRRNNK